MKRIILAAALMMVLTINTVEPASATPSSIKRAKFEKTGHVYWDIPVEEKLVAFTFDDGPDPAYTTQILDALKKYNAKATFFVIGEEAEKYPEIIERQADEGHEIGNHTYRHRFRDGYSSAMLKKELEKNAAVIKGITGVTPTLFRPIAGYYDKEIVDTAIEADYNVILWSWHQETRDWSRPGAAKITQNVISDTKSGDIIIFHDAGGDRSQTVKAVEDILKILYKNGYQCTTVSDLLYRSHSILPAPLR
ncbi:polysaccharide deacetylase family protein [Mesobacillus boroniphilus]|uniref:Polysaccharide deacetylase family protein n=1 Tax=Mesobacillus boroniphilus TaxID=308892 RepID=A0A944CMV4_9BACI|nr:polysaccharide deacetylase family protein [Mesobacillus boroniphilus]MBS8265890.1 polysaccharide deacetylase family protein [Mesobacillus boroniphilus]